MLPIQERLEYGDAPSCEAEFARIAEGASRLESVAKNLSSEARKLARAAAAGNLAALRKSRATLTQIRSTADNSFAEIETFDEGPLSRAIGSRQFLEEIVDAARRIGFSAAQLSGLSILAFPNRLTVDEKGVKIGRKSVSSVRPSALANLLKVDADKAKQAPPGFIESLSRAYDVKCPDGSRPVPLSEIYELLTLLPESRKNYSESDFVRDLSVIDAFGPHRTKDGRQISFPAATTTRMGRGFIAVSPTGDEVTYVNIRFLRDG